MNQKNSILQVIQPLKEINQEKLILACTEYQKAIENYNISQISSVKQNFSIRLQASTLNLGTEYKIL